MANENPRLPQKRIAPFGAFKPWSDDEEKQLGTMDDKKFAREFGRALSAVKQRRIKLGIPVFNSRRHAWTADDDKLLGVRPDGEVAALLRTSVRAVGRRRRSFKIPPCAKQTRAGRRARNKSGSKRKAGGRNGLFTAEEEKLLGTMPDEEVAKRIGRSFFAVQARRIKLRIPKLDPKLHRWTPKDDALLGKPTDMHVAERLGISWRAVAHRRRRLGIPVCFAHRRPWTPEEDKLLGTATDTEIAARLRRAVETVCIRRQKLGIPNFYWMQRCGRQRKFRKRSPSPPRTGRVRRYPRPSDG